MPKNRKDVSYTREERRKAKVRERREETDTETSSKSIAWVQLVHSSHIGAKLQHSTGETRERLGDLKKQTEEASSDIPLQQSHVVLVVHLERLESDFLGRIDEFVSLGRSGRLSGHLDLTSSDQNIPIKKKNIMRESAPNGKVSHSHSVPSSGDRVPRRQHAMVLEEQRLFLAEILDQQFLFVLIHHDPLCVHPVSPASLEEDRTGKGGGA